MFLVTQAKDRGCVQNMGRMSHCWGQAIVGYNHANTLRNKASCYKALLTLVPSLQPSAMEENQDRYVLFVGGHEDIELVLVVGIIRSADVIDLAVDHHMVFGPKGPDFEE